ncbi:acyltransferase [Bremerella cremea]|uniref:Acyltransferase n=1 Tax=Bremerella cremea TaxID=1031537 RepID=A0A368KML1_9BACT|nr:acyltransferase [Bremerella cremea]
MPSENEFRYRPDIDGLRAIAVALVLLFHARLGFTGGFIGVDVFFVISGYLITGLILKGQAEGRFSMGTFWQRRIRRILPASLVVVLGTLVAGRWLLFASSCGFQPTGRVRACSAGDVGECLFQLFPRLLRGPGRNATSIAYVVVGR